MKSPAEFIAAAVDADALVELAQEAVRIPSITPHEAAFADWVRTQLEAGGWSEVSLVEVESGRLNVYSRAGEGEMDARSLVLAGHLDTVQADDWTAEWIGADRADPFAGHVIDGEIWARGVTDQKGGICSIIEAIRAVYRAGYRLRGSVIGLFVCDEESGQPGSGLSLGMRAAVAELFEGAEQRPRLCGVHGAHHRAPSTPRRWVFLIADITLVGRSAYFGTPHLGGGRLASGPCAAKRVVGIRRDAANRRGAPTVGRTVPVGHQGRVRGQHRRSWKIRVVAHPKTSPRR